MACYYTDGNPPPKQWNWLLLVVLFVLALIWLAALTSCDAYHKIGNGKTPPLTTIDSNNLSFRCVATFPPQETPEYDIGTIDTTNRDSIDYYKMQYLFLYSQKQTHKDSIIKVHDTVSNDDLIGDYDEGYDYGFKVGTANGLSQCKPSTIRVDTVRTCTSSDNALIYNLQSTSALKDVQIEKLTTQLSDTTGDKNKYFWLLIIAAIGLGVGGYLAVKNKL